MSEQNKIKKLQEAALLELEKGTFSTNDEVTEAVWDYLALGYPDKAMLLIETSSCLSEKQQLFLKACIAQAVGKADEAQQYLAAAKTPADDRVATLMGRDLSFEDRIRCFRNLHALLYKAAKLFARESEPDISSDALLSKLQQDTEHAVLKIREERSKADEEEAARVAAAIEAKIKAEEEACRKAEEEARRKAEEEARRKAEEEARRKAEEEARRKAEEEARRKAEEEARRKAEEEARRKAEEEARRKAEEKARRAAEAEARRKAEAEAKRKAEEAARWMALQEKMKSDLKCYRVIAVTASSLTAAFICYLIVTIWKDDLYPFFRSLWTTISLLLGLIIAIVNIVVSKVAVMSPDRSDGASWFLTVLADVLYCASVGFGTYTLVRETVSPENATAWMPFWGVLCSLVVCIGLASPFMCLSHRNGSSVIVHSVVVSKLCCVGWIALWIYLLV